MFKIMTLCEEQSVFSEINYGVSLDFNNIWSWDSKEPMRFDNVIKAFYTLHDFRNPIRSLQITLCDMDLINLGRDICRLYNDDTLAYITTHVTIE